MKLIFLDIDGVLNWTGTEDRINGFIGLDPMLIARFNRIIDAHPDAKVVISSTWMMSLENLKKLLADRGLRGDIIGKTPRTRELLHRGEEIRAFLTEFTDPIESFVILDDDTSGMQGKICDYYLERIGEDRYEIKAGYNLTKHHVITTWDGEFVKNNDDNGYSVTEPGGLQDRHIEQAIGILHGHSA